MATVGLVFTVTLELSQDEYRLIAAGLNRQLKGDDVAKARALSEKLDGERAELAKQLTQAGAKDAAEKVLKVGTDDGAGGPGGAA